ncbi:hypothetical protein SLINC_4367 [Streptomyces lincolnensis]|uniref:Uncharacterized protein n=1 Tax=Streptomyces lincolnensis TaxID=1915 RepID=A0A1B1MDF1_STRLN|nr:VWA domain-containing protein [Streptomyces lincolnensis]ANS66591.1 hypothetical protein SLINC_4367 [Streptomyces lincolnensis]AXG55461.1 hypothetical protein SLCG_4306 [Streptomyces lincolnensis]QMV08035.1 VWA domain-containing protein [Streptomyces lincolnensis]
MGILTLLRNTFGRSRKARAAEAEGAERTPSQEISSQETTPKVPSPSPEPTPTPAPAAQSPEPRTTPLTPQEEHDLVAAAFDNITVPKQSPPAEAAADDPTPPGSTATGAPATEAPVTEVTPAAEPATSEEQTSEATAEEPISEPPTEPVTEEPVAESTAAEEPVVDELVAEEPVIDEPVAEKPVADEPVAEKPVIEESAVEDAVAETPEAPAEATPEPETTPEPEPAAEAPAEEPTTEPPAAEDATTDPTPEPATEQEPEATVTEATPEPQTAEAPETTDSPAAADGEDTPQGPPAADDEASTGGAGGNNPSEGEAEDAETAPQPQAPAEDAETAPQPHAPTEDTVPATLRTAYQAAATTLTTKNLTGANAKVYLVLDRSASMRPYYKDGSAQALGEQTLALAAHLDPAGTENAKVHVVFFSTEVDGTGELTLTDHDTKIDDLHAGLGRMGRTSYHVAVEEVIAQHTKAAPDTPALVVFQTDGAPDAKTPATQALTDAAKNHPHVFFSFIAFGDPENKAFDYLRKLKTPNTSHFLAGETPRELTDAEVYEGILATWRP